MQFFSIYTTYIFKTRLFNAKKFPFIIASTIENILTLFAVVNKDEQYFVFSIYTSIFATHALV